ncbi:MAG: adenosine kinase [Vulcanimicrobiaceae bacterium]
MTSAAYHVVGIGNAIVDVITTADDAFLERYGMAKGAMTLVDEARAEALYADMGPTTITSGGSAANTIAGIASLGGRTAYIGKVHDDLLGTAFRHDMTSIGATFRTASAATGPTTARCLIFVTPDAQRTMHTYLGACAQLGPADVDADLIASAQITYLEGYLYDEPHAKEAFHRAAEIAHAAGRKVSLSLSDAFCVNRHRDAFLKLVDHHVDVLFANESEITALFETTDVDVAVARVRELTDLTAITRDARGSIVVTHDETIAVPATRVDHVVDTTGAGDLYAAGFLYNLATGASHRACAELASAAAADIIAHVGARPQAPLTRLLATV